MAMTTTTLPYNRLFTTWDFALDDPHVGRLSHFLNGYTKTGTPFGFWGNFGFWWQCNVVRQMSELFTTPSDVRVLDIAGEGRLVTPYLRHLGYPIEIADALTDYDYRPIIVEQCQAGGFEIPMHDVRLTSLLGLPDQSYDVVLCTSLTVPLQTMIRVLKAGGYLMLGCTPLDFHRFGFASGLQPVGGVHSDPGALQCQTANRCLLRRC